MSDRKNDFPNFHFRANSEFGSSKKAVAQVERQVLVYPSESSQPRRHEKFLDRIFEYNLEGESQQTECTFLKIF